MKKTYNNVDVVVNDPQSKFTANKEKGQAKVTWCQEKSTFTIDFPGKRKDSDITVLYGNDSPIGIRSKRNNNTESYTILFNLTGTALRAFGRQKVKNELISAYAAIWNDMIGS